MNEKEFRKAWDKAKKTGFGIYDTKRQLSINPDSLAFFWDSKKRKDKPLEEVVLLRNLMKLKDIYREKFGNDSPYDLKLLRKDPAAFVERMIRAVEICSLNYVLNTGEGSLNLCPQMNIVMGKRTFLWEH